MSRPPVYEGIQADFDALELSLRKFLSEGKQVLMCGDLNCDLLRPSLPHVRPLSSLINNVAMHQGVSQPTRVTNISSTLIDIVLVSDHSLVTDCRSESCIVSDHNLVIAKMMVRRAKMKANPVSFRRWNNTDYRAFSRDLHDACWSPVLKNTNADEAWRSWTDIVVPILDRHAPVVSVASKHKSGFGVSAATRNLIRSAATQLRVCRRSGLLSDHALYKNLRRQVRRAISTERRLKFESSVKTNRSSRNTWNLINSALGKSKVAQCLDSRTARSFNEFFCSAGVDVQSSANFLPCSNTAVSGTPESCIIDNESIVLSTKFDQRTATLAELCSVVHSLNLHSAPGPDGLPVSLFKLFLGRLAYPIMHVFNSSITSEVVPQC